MAEKKNFFHERLVEYEMVVKYLEKLVVEKILLLF